MYVCVFEAIVGDENMPARKSDPGMDVLSAWHACTATHPMHHSSMPCYNR